MSSSTAIVRIARHPTVRTIARCAVGCVAAAARVALEAGATETRHKPDQRSR